MEDKRKKNSGSISLYTHTNTPTTTTTTPAQLSNDKSAGSLKFRDSSTTQSPVILSELNEINRTADDDKLLGVVVDQGGDGAYEVGDTSFGATTTVIVLPGDNNTHTTSTKGDNSKDAQDSNNTTSQQQRRKRSGGGSGGCTTPGSPQPRVHFSGEDSVCFGGGRGDRVHFSEDRGVHFSDDNSESSEGGFSRSISSKHSSIGGDFSSVGVAGGQDYHQQHSPFHVPFQPPFLLNTIAKTGTSTDAFGMIDRTKAARRPKDLQLPSFGAHQHNPIGVRPTGSRQVKPQHHRFSYVHCDNYSRNGGSFNRNTPSGGKDGAALITEGANNELTEPRDEEKRRSNSCPALIQVSGEGGGVGEQQASHQHKLSNASNANTVAALQVHQPNAQVGDMCVEILGHLVGALPECKKWFQQ